MTVGNPGFTSAGAAARGATRPGVAVALAMMALSSPLHAAESPQVDASLQRCLERLGPAGALEFAALERRCPDLRQYLVRSGVAARLPTGWDQRGTRWDAARLLQLAQLMRARRAVATHVATEDAGSRRLESTLRAAAAGVPATPGDSATRGRIVSSGSPAPDAPAPVPDGRAPGDSWLANRPAIGLLALLLTLGLLSAAVWPMCRALRAARGRRRPERPVGRRAATPTAGESGLLPAAAAPASADAGAELRRRDPRPARWWAALAEAWMLRQPELAARALSTRELAARLVAGPPAAAARSELLAWAALSEQVRFAARPPPAEELESLLARVGAPSAWLPRDGAMPAVSRQ